MSGTQSPEGDGLVNGARVVAQAHLTRPSQGHKAIGLRYQEGLKFLPTGTLLACSSKTSRLNICTRVEEVPPDNFVEAHITWETRGSKELFSRGLAVPSKNGTLQGDKQKGKQESAIAQV